MNSVDAPVYRSCVPVGWSGGRHLFLAGISEVSSSLERPVAAWQPLGARGACWRAKFLRRLRHPGVLSLRGSGGYIGTVDVARILELVRGTTLLGYLCCDSYRLLSSRDNCIDESLQQLERVRLGFRFCLAAS